MAPDDNSATADDSSTDSLWTRGEDTTPHPLPGRQTLSIPALDSPGTLDYHPESETYRGEFDLHRAAPSEVVVHAVAAVADESPLALDSLYGTVDTDALDALLTSQLSGAHTGDVSVTFTYLGHEVTVHSYGIVEITPESGRTPEERP